MKRNKRIKAADGNFWQQTGLNYGDLGLAGAQLLANIGSSLVNQNAINKLHFTPIYTPTFAEAPVKYNTTYNINPQISRLRESLAKNRQEILDNTASSKTAFGRMLHNSWLGVDTYNNLYGTKLNQETSMLNVDAQNRQNVFARNANRLQHNIASDLRYNTQGRDNLRNTKTMLTSQNWSNAINQGIGTLANTYNRGQQRLQDANSLFAIMASDQNAMNFFFNEDGTMTDKARELLNRSRDMVGAGPVFKLGGKSSLIRNR